MFQELSSKHELSFFIVSENSENYVYMVNLHHFSFWESPRGERQGRGGYPKGQRPETKSPLTSGHAYQGGLYAIFLSSSALPVSLSVRGELSDKCICGSASAASL